MTSVLALDLSRRSTGWACDSPGDARPLFGTFCAPPAMGTRASGLGLGRPLFYFRRFLAEKIADCNPDVCVYEAPLHIAGKHRTSRVTDMTTVRILLGLAAETESVCFEHHVPCEEAAIGTIKHYLAGHGRADDAAMIAAARRLGWPVTCADEAVAVGLWGLTHATKDPTWRLATGPLFAEAAR